MRRFAIALTAFAIATTTACGDKAGENLVAAATMPGAGTYSLRSIDGKPLPYTWPNGTILVGNTLILAGDGTYRYISQGFDSQGGNATEFVDTGTWVSDGTNATLDPHNGGLYTGTFNGSQFTMLAAGVTSIYDRF